jgi:hypothetical protein
LTTDADEMPHSQLESLSTTKGFAATMCQQTTNRSANKSLDMEDKSFVSTILEN